MGRGPATPAPLAGIPSNVTSIAISPDGKTLAAGAVDNTIKLWDLASGQELRTLSTHHPDDSASHGVLNILFSPDGTRLASGFELFRFDVQFHFLHGPLDTASGQHMRSWNAYWLSGMAFSPDGKMLAWGTSAVYWKDNNVIVTESPADRCCTR